MLTMRSSPAIKMAKPPPPIPPRPSKTIVAEAFINRRRNKEATNTVPVRSAPPPPLDLSRSQSNGCPSLEQKKSNVMYERSISDELKSNSRTIIFQSSNMKTVKKDVLVRKNSLNKDVTVNNVKISQSDKVPNNKTLSEGVEIKNDVVVSAKNILNNRDGAENCAPLRKISESDEVTINLNNVVTCVVPTKEEPTKVIIDSHSPITTLQDTAESDDKWEEMLKDKNHVNMLIDEMFASVLEDSKVQKTDKQSFVTATVSTDTTTITISGCDNSNYDSSCNIQTNGPTVLIIENSDVQNLETIPKFNGGSSAKIGGSTETLDSSCSRSNSSTMEKKSVQFDDKKNAELLIEELESMRMEQERILKRQRKRSQEIYDSVNGEECDNEEGMKNCHINIVNLNGSEKGTALDYERLKTMSSLHGLPPLPKSLSGFNLSENYSNPPTPARTSSMRSNQSPAPLESGHSLHSSLKGVNGAAELPSLGQGRKPTNLDAQLAILRREMYSLRQLDLSLLSQLWSLNESIQDFRQILQEQEECRVLSPPSPSPAPSSCDEGDGEELYYVNASSVTPSLKFRAAPPPPPARRSSNSSNASTGG